MTTSTKGPRRGFTLVEILIVVVILGILAAIVIPRFANASQNAAEATVRSQLRQLRGQLEMYRTRTLHYPRDLRALVDENYLRSLPVHPNDEYLFRYTSATGEVVSTMNSSW